MLQTIMIRLRTLDKDLGTLAADVWAELYIIPDILKCEVTQIVIGDKKYAEDMEQETHNISHSTEMGGPTEDTLDNSATEEQKLQDIEPVSTEPSLSSMAGPEPLQFEIDFLEVELI